MKREEGGDPASPINSETVSSDQMERGEEGKKNVSIVISRFPNAVKLGRVV